MDPETPVRSLTPDLMVEDLEATVEWYRRVFDADVVATLPADGDEPPWWAQVMIDGAPLMFQRRDSLEGKLPNMEGVSIGGSVAFYLDVDDAAGFHDDLVSNGVEVTRELHETEFGWRQFAAADPNGYTLWFGEKLSEEDAREIGQRYRTYHDDLTDDGSGRPAQRQFDEPSKRWG
ncbi:hypothetical protein BRC93_14085 [Halobacteriales archaeon QS_5_70_15]|nr:MAG: hypothetical protein BRC93_14085 [Halobacteriales archaeon QS_5_70_15]